MASVRDGPGVAIRSRCLWAFSIMTMAASTMAPMAMAMPPRLIRLELMPMARMPMKAARMPTGSMTMATRAERVEQEDDAHRATIRLSSVSVRFRVSMARMDQFERS